MEKALEEMVWRRASNRCEYCQLLRDLSALPFQMDHIIARKHGGATVAHNLALACFYCNSHKGPNIAGLDSESGELTRLFHPRTDTWVEHFEWQGAFLNAHTAVGRVTIAVLAINRSEYASLRQALIDEGVFPPT